MKACVVFVVAIAAVSSLGSGPYLPSGWKPKGPAFTLPTEVEKILEAPQEDIQVESEASGSDFLREYGPPVIQDIYQAISEQALPGVNTERAFVIPNVKVSEEQQFVSVNVTQTVEQVRSNAFESVDAKLDDVQPIEEAIKDTTEDNVERTEEGVLEEEKLIKFEVAEDGTTEISLKDTVSDTEVKINDDSTSPSAQPDETAEKLKEQVQTTEQALANELDSPLVPDELIYIDVSNVGENVSNNIVQDIEEVKEKEGSRSLKEAAEEVDQEAIGFREYGPPKDGADKIKSEVGRIEVSETRRRRFSSKFAPAKKH